MRSKAATTDEERNEIVKEKRKEVNFLEKAKHPVYQPKLLSHFFFFQIDASRFQFFED